jgi:hypothetical protein
MFIDPGSSATTFAVQFGSRTLPSAPAVQAGRRAKSSRWVPARGPPVQPMRAFHVVSARNATGSGGSGVGSTGAGATTAGFRFRSRRRSTADHHG